MSESLIRSRLNIRGVVDLDQLAVILSGLIDQVDRQNKVIAELQNSLSNYVTNQSFIERTTNLENVVAKALTRIDAIQEAATSTVMNKKVSSGNLASSNYKQLTNLSKLVAECATKLELDHQKVQLNETKESLSILRVDFDKSLGVIDQLSNSQLQQSKRIGALETSVAGKLDRSECDHLESLVAKVLLYDQFKVDTTNAVAELQKFRHSSLSLFTRYDEHFKHIDSDIQLANIGISRAATKKETHSLAKELQAHDALLATCASQTSVNSVMNAFNFGTFLPRLYKYIFYFY
jgi:hypothetical protein